MEFDATFLIAAISFIVFVFIMNRVFYAPVLKIMQMRQDYVEENFASAKKTDEEAKKQTEYRDSELEKTRNYSQNIIAEKSQELKKETSKKIAEYKEERYANIKEERDSLLQSAMDAKEILKDKVVDIAKDISVNLFGESIDSNAINKSQIKEQEDDE